MNIKFKITGLFYEASGYKCRKYLNIKRVGNTQDKPDIMVVMMNPGSSYPLDGVDNNSIPSEAYPDTTQQQVMKVMDAALFNYARILNLSDLRTPDSSELYKFLKSKESNDVEHSIFSANRKADLKQFFIKNIPVIFGWGVNSNLVPLAKQAIESLCINNPLGMLKSNTKYSYYHPLPRIYKRQLEWVQHVTNQVKNTRT